MPHLWASRKAWLYEHSGSVATLEDWFDPKRLEPDYVPTGWKAHGTTTRAVVGYEFGLDLTGSLLAQPEIPTRSSTAREPSSPGISRASAAQ